MKFRMDTNAGRQGSTIPISFAFNSDSAEETRGRHQLCFSRCNSLALFPFPGQFSFLPCLNKNRGFGIFYVGVWYKNQREIWKLCSCICWVLFPWSVQSVTFITPKRHNHSEAFLAHAHTSSSLRGQFVIWSLFMSKRRKNGRSRWYEPYGKGIGISGAFFTR